MSLKLFKVEDASWDARYDICKSLVVYAESIEEAQQIAISETKYYDNHDVFVTGVGLEITEVPFEKGFVLMDYN